MRLNCCSGGGGQENWDPSPEQEIKRLFLKRELNETAAFLPHVC